MNVLAVFREFRGQGIGSTLLEIAEQIARASDVNTLSIIVGSWNPGASRLYERAGYRTVASEAAVVPPGFPHSGDWLLLTKQVTP